MRILVAEDDPDIANLVVHYVSREGWTPQIATSGTDALAKAIATPPDLLILDVMLPGTDGFEVCRALRGATATATIPIIMLTARADEADRIKGLEIGADDYVLKPFSPNELIARIKALARRVNRSDAASEDLRIGPVSVDRARHLVTLAGQEVSLTAKEFVLLVYFLEHRGRVLSRDALLTDVWGYSYTGGTRTVDVHVRRLREKLPYLTEALVTVPQFGYKLVEPTA